jgi:ubiquinone/menaquinone biosynthesis C-methylase UbiE
MSSVKQKLKYLVPVRVKKFLKYILYSFQDLIAYLKGEKNEYPPKRLNFVGSSEFAKVGHEFAGYFIKLCNLKPNEKVLDIGCGIGRMAIPLTKHLSNDGEYFGFDIDKRGIFWCNKNISKKYPNFHFEYVDLYNKYYNKKGKIKASDFKFPYPDGHFDFVFATSVFTHMLTNDVVHYLEEIKRVLKPNGRALTTFFSIDDDARKNINDGISRCQFVYPSDENSYYSHKTVKEAEIGYNEKWINDKLGEIGFSVNKVLHGSWSARKDYISYQDIYIFNK